MVKCGREIIYESVGEKSLVACTIEKCPYNNKGVEFMSSGDGKNYSVCKTKGIVKTINNSL